MKREKNSKKKELESFDFIENHCVERISKYQDFLKAYKEFEKCAQKSDESQRFKRYSSRGFEFLGRQLEDIKEVLFNDPVISSYIKELKAKYPQYARYIKKDDGYGRRNFV